MRHFARSTAQTDPQISRGQNNPPWPRTYRSIFTGSVVMADRPLQDRVVRRSSEEARKSRTCALCETNLPGPVSCAGRERDAGGRARHGTGRASRTAELSRGLDRRASLGRLQIIACLGVFLAARPGAREHSAWPRRRLAPLSSSLSSASRSCSSTTWRMAVRCRRRARRADLRRRQDRVEGCRPASPHDKSLDCIIALMRGGTVTQKTVSSS